LMIDLDGRLDERSGHGSVTLEHCINSV